MPDPMINRLLIPVRINKDIRRRLPRTYANPSLTSLCRVPPVEADASRSTRIRAMQMSEPIKETPSRAKRPRIACVSSIPRLFIAASARPAMVVPAIMAI